MKANKIVFLISIIIMLPFLSIAQQMEKRIITVNGDAEVRVVPDEVLLTFGVETNNKKLNLAKEENDQIIKNIFTVAKNLLVEQKHIQTDYLGIEPRYKDYYNHITDFIGYTVKKTIVITIRDLSKFEDVLTNVLGAGANHIHGIKFQTTELRKYKDQARSLAIKAAKEKATAMANELGQKISVPYNIQENNSGWWSGYNSWWGSRWSGLRSQNTIQNVQSPNPVENDGTIALGQIKVNASVTVSFELQ